MKKNVGLWIDHRQAVIVINLDSEEEIRRVTSNMEKRVRYSGASQASGAGESRNGNDGTEDRRDRRFDDQINRYYDEVISYLRDATSIMILGPGEAKGELQKRLEAQGLGDRIVAVRAADKMTDDQITAAVRQRFEETQPGSGKIAQ